MTKSLFTGFLFLTAILFTLSSCHKYEEGPKYTVLTKKMRMTNSWSLQTISVNGSGGPATGTTKWHLEKDKSAQLVHIENNTTTAIVGDWDFNGSKTKLVITEKNGNFEEYTILKLKNKELKLSQDSGTDVIVWTFISDL